MDHLKRLGDAALIPVVVIEDAKDALSTAHALIAGGIDVMEITLRTKAGLDSIRSVVDGHPEMCVGAGTVLTLEQCKEAVQAGAKFIVSPGFDEEMVKWCLESGITVIPGCVTPTEITKALKFGLNVLKFFPADAFGGLPALTALANPFGMVKFIPTGGVNAKNLADYLSKPFIHSVGGSWICSKSDISNGNFERITTLSREAMDIAFGFSIAHIGINAIDQNSAFSVAKQLEASMGLPLRETSASYFAGTGVEIMKSLYRGTNGHVAIQTCNVERAISLLEKKGFTIDPESVRVKDGNPIFAYIHEEIGGFAFHLTQK